MLTIRIPASTSNLGPGFDVLGLALGLHLMIGVEASTDPWGSFLFQGEGADSLRSAQEENMIFRAMRFAADREGIDLRPARIYIKNEIPLARGLGSSGAAIIAGLTLFEVLSGAELGQDKLLGLATEIEGHSDNVSAALLGGFVVSSVSEDGRVSAQKLDWPDEVKAVVVVPDFKLHTEEARSVIPRQVSLADAVFNLQRSSLLVAAVAGRGYHLIGEAMRDRLHQPHRAPLVPGLAEVLEMGAAELLSVPGFLGLSLSGSGPTVIAFATDNFDVVSEAIARCFEAHGISSTVRVLDIEAHGRIIEETDEED